MTKSRIEPGSLIDGFVIGEQVHSGGMATLWGVTHPGISVPLLMKIPRVSEGADPAAIVSFEMEQMILPRLSGPHVPQCFGTGDFARQAYVVLERIPGRTLYRRLPQLPLPYQEAAALVGKIAAALADLHRQNVVHHDIKPSSIMFRESGEAVLIDYGLSHHNHLPDLLQEEFRVPYGTAPYMAPERLRGVRDDPRSDLFSLGVLLYFFTTGERPFGEGCGAIRTRRADSTPIIRPGCRRSCCGASRSSRPGAIRRRRSLPSISAMPARSGSPRARKGSSAILSRRCCAGASTASWCWSGRRPTSRRNSLPARSSRSPST
jgi:serine/threonine protein kinase